MKTIIPTMVAVFAVAVVAWLAMAAVFIIFGQDRAPTLVVVNNSGQVLTVTTKGTTIPLATSALAEIPFVATIPVFVIRTADGRTWKYNWVPLNGSRYRSRIYLQVEADGAIHVLSGKDTGTSKSLPTQPFGYPLRPR